MQLASLSKETTAGTTKRLGKPSQSTKLFTEVKADAFASRIAWNLFRPISALELRYSPRGTLFQRLCAAAETFPADSTLLIAEEPNPPKQLARVSEAEHLKGVHYEEERKEACTWPSRRFNILTQRH